MVVTLGQQYNVGEIPTGMLYTLPLLIAMQGRTTSASIIMLIDFNPPIL